MRFKICCSYWEHGERALTKYACLEKYNAVIEGEELYITLNSLQDLIDIKNEIKESIIIDSDKENYLVIYDDYIE
jgi:hypothetical protein